MCHGETPETDDRAKHWFQSTPTMSTRFPAFPAGCPPSAAVLGYVSSKRVICTHRSDQIICPYLLQIGLERFSHPGHILFYRQFIVSVLHRYLQRFDKSRRKEKKWLNPSRGKNARHVPQWGGERRAYNVPPGFSDDQEVARQEERQKDLGWEI